MTTNKKTYWMVSFGMVFLCAGLVSSFLSNPRRFPSGAEFDRQIDMLAASGFVCTIIGIGLLMKAAGYTTKSMIPEKKSKANTGVGIGFVLQTAGFFLLKGEAYSDLIGLLLLLAGLPIFTWGCMNYAQGKGHSKWIGLLGMASIIGLILLIVLPDQNQETVS